MHDKQHPVDARPIVVVSMGDPAGIGPEIALKMMANDHDFLAHCRPVVVGDARILARAARQINSAVQVRPLTSLAEAQGLAGMVDLVDLNNAPPADVAIGEVGAVAGAAAVAYIKHATQLVLDGQAAAIVTGPINKASMNKAGFAYAGHTELLAELTGATDVSMMLVSSQLRVLHVSTHVSLREACERAKQDRVLRVIRLADSAVKQLGIAAPRIAVAGLNPHAGEGGLFGDEELTEITPAVEQARAAGIDATGPWPPDTVFLSAVRGQFDVVVAMYHDQGHIPMKLMGFEEGVNVSIGLPIIRTSVDHGTAFDIAGQGIASDTSLVAAMDVAVQMINAQRA